MATPATDEEADPQAQVRSTGSQEVPGSRPGPRRQRQGARDADVQAGRISKSTRDKIQRRRQQEAEEEAITVISMRRYVLQENLKSLTAWVMLPVAASRCCCS